MGGGFGMWKRRVISPSHSVKTSLYTWPKRPVMKRSVIVRRSSRDPPQSLSLFEGRQINKWLAISGALNIAAGPPHRSKSQRRAFLLMTRWSRCEEGCGWRLSHLIPACCNLPGGRELCCSVGWKRVEKEEERPLRERL